MRTVSINVSAKTTESDRDKYYASAGKAKDESPSEIMDKLPADYYDYVDLFNRKAAHSLPPRRLGLDYEIKLLPGTQPPFKRPYPMSSLENEVVKH